MDYLEDLVKTDAVRSKHMVSLRGSKFGSRVAMLCSLPAYGHPTNIPPPSNSRFSSAPAGARFGSAYR